MVKSNSATTRKKVVLRRLDAGLLRGYVSPKSFLRGGDIEVLDEEGRVVVTRLNELKGVFFVRDFEGNPERLERKLFGSRPKFSGLWVRMTFRDKEVIEGIIPNNLLGLDPRGFLVIPPDAYSNNLKIFVPRRALVRMEVLGVISRAAAVRRRALPQGQRAQREAAEASGSLQRLLTGGKSSVKGDAGGRRSTP